MASLSERLFSRGSTPPPVHALQQPLQPQQVSPQQEHREPTFASLIDQPQQTQQTQQDNPHIDALFRNIGPVQPVTASSSPMSHSSAVSSQHHTAADKQSALLSQLYGAPHGQVATQEHRPPTPPAPQQYQIEGPNQNSTNNPGKMLLESLMSG